MSQEPEMTVSSIAVRVPAASAPTVNEVEVHGVTLYVAEAAAHLVAGPFVQVRQSEGAAVFIAELPAADPRWMERELLEYFESKCEQAGLFPYVHVAVERIPHVVSSAEAGRDFVREVRQLAASRHRAAWLEKIQGVERFGEHWVRSAGQEPTTFTIVLGMTNRRAWFASEPNSIPVGSLDLLLGDRAVESRAWDGHAEQDEYQQRPTPDWGATAVLRLARLQLDEMVYLVRAATGIDDPRSNLEKTQDELRNRTFAAVTHEFLQTDEGGEGAVERVALEINNIQFELGAIHEGFLLRDALDDPTPVNHGFAVDGSIAMTTGPDIPALAIFNLRGTTGGELGDEPMAIFKVARHATVTAAELLAKITALEAWAARGGGAF
jgi:hypothetical protein